ARHAQGDRGLTRGGIDKSHHVPALGQRSSSIDDDSRVISAADDNEPLGAHMAIPRLIGGFGGVQVRKISTILSAAWPSPKAPGVACASLRNSGVSARRNAAETEAGVALASMTLVPRNRPF